MKEWRWWKGPYTCQEAYQQVSHSHWRSNRNGVRKPKIPYLWGVFRFHSFANVPVRVKSKRNTFNFEKCTLYFPSKIITNSYLARSQKIYRWYHAYDIFNMYCTSLYFYKMAFIIVKSSVWVLEWSDFFYFTSRFVL